MIKDSELEIFERGSPADLQLNFAIFLLGMAMTGLAALFTGTFSNNTAHTTFIVFVVVGLVVGIYLLLSWSRNRTSSKTICARIRKRIKEIEAPTTTSITQTPKSESEESLEPKD